MLSWFWTLAHAADSLTQEKNLYSFTLVTVLSSGLVCFHKPVSEAQKELVNAFSKSHVVVTTTSSCMTVLESPKSLSGICNALTGGNQN